MLEVKATGGKYKGHWISVVSKERAIKEFGDDIDLTSLRKVTPRVVEYSHVNTHVICHYDDGSQIEVVTLGTREEAIKMTNKMNESIN